MMGKKSELAAHFIVPPSFALNPYSPEKGQLRWTSGCSLYVPSQICQRTKRKA